MKHSDTINKLSEALCKAQKNFKTAIKKSKNPFFNSNYADYTEILGCVKQALNNEGISILQPIDNDVVETVLLHESGEFISSTTKIYNISNKPQDYGSAITYARRYALSSILSIDSDEDDDGNRANCNTVVPSKPTQKKTSNPITDKDRMIRIQKYLTHFIETQKFKDSIELEAYLGVSLSDIPNNLDKVEQKIKTILTAERK